MGSYSFFIQIFRWQILGVNVQKILILAVCENNKNTNSRNKQRKFPPKSPATGFYCDCDHSMIIFYQIIFQKTNFKNKPKCQSFSILFNGTLNIRHWSVKPSSTAVSFSSALVLQHFFKWTLTLLLVFI